MPFWCQLITRVVKPKSAEARCDSVQKALEQELASITGKGVWDTKDVYSPKDLSSNPDILEAMLGRVFAIS